MNEVTKIIYEIIIWLFLMYSMGIFSVYTWIAIYSYGAVVRYKYGNIYTDYALIATNPVAPSFSLIAPAYNEGKTIVENVRSLLSIYYNKLEIIIVNDGSKDDSIDRLVEAYQLEKVSFVVHGNLKTKEIIQVYKSKNPAFKKLIVVDKQNGGKADALNVGINISKSDYIVCIDVDCIIDQEAILKLAKPFMEQEDKRLIACGGVIRLANNCQIENGKVVKVNLPKSLLGRSQALEYIRAFLLGRMAWSRASGLILISGAFGAFDKEIVLECGGYDHSTVGEDMELVVRMRRYMIEQGLPHQVINIPDPLCWTEVPEDKEVLKKQRNRWMRGTMETLWTHRKLMFNPKYGKLGMVSLPYWFFFEFLGPFVEFMGYIIFILFVLFGIINWSFFFSLFALVVFSSILYSVYAVCVDLVSHQVYSKRKDLTLLILTAAIEPFYFHPLIVRAGVAGMVDYFRKKNGWGEMTRQGFSQAKDETFKEKAVRYINWLMEQFSPVAFVFLLLVLLTSAAEWLIYGQSVQQFKSATSFVFLLANNLLTSAVFVLPLLVLYSIVSFFNETLAKWFIRIMAAIALIAQLVLAFYFIESKNLLGADLFFYSTEELISILRSSNVLNLLNISMIVIGVLGLIFIIQFFSNKIKGSNRLAYSILGVGILAAVYLFFFGSIIGASKDDFMQTAERSKLGYFLASNASLVSENIQDELFPSPPESVYGAISAEYPFLRAEQSKDALGSYFQKSDQIPNLVLILIEGLGNAYSSSNGYIGDFTPFLSQLKDSSLVWENNLSSSGRTFSVLPTILGSLPFGSSGFLEQKEYPDHFNLLNVFSLNNFKTGFVYGGDAGFDYMSKYLNANAVDRLIDESSFPAGYKKLPSGNSGESWGYEDQAVFDQLIAISTNQAKPYFHIALTLSTHNPFLINDDRKFESMFGAQLAKLKLTKTKEALAMENKKQLVSVINVDDALKTFFTRYKELEDFKNTIFIITGDHAMPEIPLETKIDRFHVPLIIYSPLLKSHRKFQHTVSHFDIAPSILAYYRENYQLKTPKTVTWIGQGLDIGASKKSMGIPMMQSKSQLIDFVYGNVHINDNRSFRLNDKLVEEPMGSADADQATKTRFDAFRDLNRGFIKSNKLVPDSTYQQFLK
ncbi:sulfatase-like hydrolase/transferase [Sphingobacterium sp. DK4209]|uniref:Sulfatase-like hydrolase/transferase n=1 Tax=Sphingobacterium zhuxiongii TaxID=2662364 RepID=A0A5Q0QCP5_9SPHI|nr:MULTISPECIES: sulfatase-like hydrolase/transferase [unclassified Sphingobacterium]MVZ64640.1 sulfatase-like hydrolase/transferase [Sphingobacterium sp. DK4209]QGA26979.1 sulfatase-like hydrolase/transferase [Sphingobacterium sp. dk4302]